LRETEPLNGEVRAQLFKSDVSSGRPTETYEAIVKTSSSTGISNSRENYAPIGRGSISSLVTSRFKHIVTSEGHAVITGRDGDTLHRCEDEPIHIPGAVQRFGLLITLQEEAKAASCTHRR
jgi:hypothetical protein